jgi:hypothetical protein
MYLWIALLIVLNIMINFRSILSLKDCNNSGLRIKEQIKVWKTNSVLFRCITINLIQIIIKNNLKAKFYIKKQLNKEKRVRKQLLIKERVLLIKCLKMLDLWEKQHHMQLFLHHLNSNKRIKVQKVKVNFLELRKCSDHLTLYFVQVE